MSIQTELSRIQGNRNTIRAKLVELGMANSNDTLDKLAAAIDALINQGAVSVTVQEGDTYTIPAGYHNGSGTVSGVAGGGSYNLQSKTVTPTKKQQSITPDAGYYGLSDVTVASIPEAYQDVSSVTAIAAEVLTGKIFVAADGTVITGVMPNNGAVSKTLDGTTVSYIIPKGYHNGSGSVKITLESKSITPTKSAQTVTPTAGKVLSSVSVAAIPENYIDTTDANATAANILTDKTAYVNGSKVVGAMPNNAAVSKVLQISSESYTVPAGYHNGSGTVSIVTEGKTATPTKSAQTITPTAGKVLSSVMVEAIPEAYQNVSNVTAEARDVLAGAVFVNSAGTEVAGSMPDNGAVSGTIDGLTGLSFEVPAGYTSGGTVTLTNDIEDALAAI